MKKIISVIASILFLNLLGNPIMPGPAIEELYWDGEDWHLVMKMRSDEENLNQYYLSCNSGISHFVDDYQVSFDETFIITNADLQQELNFNPESDSILIFLEDSESWEMETEWFIYNPEGSWHQMIDFPQTGQSLAWYTYTDYMMMESVNYFLITDANSMYFNENEPQQFGTISGYVYDQNQNPVVGAQIEFFKNINISHFTFPDQITDENGYYEVETYAKIYEISASYNSVCAEALLTVIPNETVNQDFQLDCAEIEGEEIPQTGSLLKNQPNPFKTSGYNRSQGTEIVYQIDDLENVSTAAISIYNSKGQKIVKIPVDPNRDKITWRAENQASGVYFYNLIVDGKVVCKEKMLLLK